LALSVSAVAGPAGLHPLGQGVLDEPHPAQLADHVDAGARRLEELVELGQVDATLGRAEDQPDGLDRALHRAAGVADAVVGVDQPRGVADQAEDVALRAGGQAGEAADADVGVDDRVERAGDVLLLGHLLPEDLGVGALDLDLADVGQRPAHDGQGQRGAHDECSLVHAPRVTSGVGPDCAPLDRGRFSHIGAGRNATGPPSDPSGFPHPTTEPDIRVGPGGPLAKQECFSTRRRPPRRL
jgi:hypothetical protein